MYRTMKNRIRYVTFKYDSNGLELWVSRYTGPNNASDQPNKVAVDG